MMTLAVLAPQHPFNASKVSAGTTPAICLAHSKECCLHISSYLECTAATTSPHHACILTGARVLQTPYIPLWRFEAALCPGPIKEGVPAVPELAQSLEDTPAEPAAAEPEPEPEPEPEQAVESKVSTLAALAPHCQ